MKTFIYILLGGVVAWLVLWQADVRELNNSKLYDGCYEQYHQNQIASSDFVKFMSNCMK